jgi:hypothetical protein
METLETASINIEVLCKKIKFDISIFQVLRKQTSSFWYKQKRLTLLAKFGTRLFRDLLKKYFIPSKLMSLEIKLQNKVNSSSKKLESFSTIIYNCRNKKELA